MPSVAGSALAVGMEAGLARFSHLARIVPGSRRLGGDAEIRGIAYDSRRVTSGDLFVAIPGYDRDGRAYIDEAIAHGAAAVVSEAPAPQVDVPRLEVPDAREALALLARACHGQPDAVLTMVGITGTNGKTTTALLLAAACDAAGLPAGVVGTLGAGSGGVFTPGRHTTPEAPDLYTALDNILHSGRKAAVLEVSSHALALKRVHGMKFDVAVFTNLTRDHLDFHKNMNEYFAAKARLFLGLPPHAAMAVNLDDPFGTRLLSPSRTRVVTFGRATRADVLPLELATTIDGLRLKLRTPKGDVVVVSALLGRTNVANIMAAMAAACALDLNLEDAAAGIHEVKSIPGRAERIDEGQEFLVLVDYAHTDDALIQILSSARELAAGRLLVVFGCGGDRDNSKRALMGAAAARLADMAFLTSDNPRSEDPLVILEQVVSGFGGQNPAVAPVIEPDRTAAIHAAIAEARPGDVLVIAGKGHETRQILAHGNIPFDDREVARQALRNRFGKDT